METYEYLWTPLARSMARQRRAEEEMPGSMEHFAAALLTTDVFIKVSTLCALGLAQLAAHRHISSRAFRLSRTNSTADWLSELDGLVRTDLRKVVLQPAVHEWAMEMVRFFSQVAHREDSADLVAVAEPLLTTRNALLHTDQPLRRVTPLGLLRWIVEIRNKTIGHGAAGPEFWKSHAAELSAATNWMVNRVPLGTATLLVAVPGTDGQPVGRVLSGLEPRAVVDPGTLDLGQVGCVCEDDRWEIPPLIWVRTSDNHCFLINGSWRDADHSAEFLCHAIASASPSEGRIRRPLPTYSTPPSLDLKPSETEGLSRLVEGRKLFHNLPPRPEGYVHRPTLEADLSRVLQDTAKRHIVNVRGMGGIGKTSLVLRQCWDLMEVSECPYTQMIWVSARDIDLTLAGPRPVRQATGDLEAMWDRYATLWDEDLEAAREFFEVAAKDEGAPMLVVVDNFETFVDQSAAYSYLDDVVHPPSKVIVTSRHDFKGDFQIPVRGMEFAEAHGLIRTAARKSGREGLVDDEMCKRIFDKCQGHPYAMKLAASTVQSKVGLTQTLSETFADPDVLDAMFRQSISQLDEGAEFLFLLVGRFATGISDAALQVAIQPEQIALTDALRQLHQLSLVEVDAESGSQAMPAMAREFAGKLLAGHVHATGVESAARFVKHWPDLVQGDVPAAAAAMERHITGGNGEGSAGRVAQALNILAVIDGSAWKHVARVRRELGAPVGRVEEAFKRAVEEDPRDPELYLEWADAVQDLDRRVQLRVQAATADPRDFKVASSVARFLVEFRHAHKHRYDKLRWGSLLRPVADVLQANLQRLDGNDCSRLAWLYLHLEEEGRARPVVERGLSVDAENHHLVRLTERLGISLPSP